MAFSPDILSILVARLNKAKELSLNNSRERLNNYQEVLQAIIQEELGQEISVLETIIAYEGNATVLFEQRCQERALQNKGTCLSILEMPFGVCNQLYFDLVHIIYPEATLADYLRLLLPGAAFYLTAEFTAISRNIDLHLVKKPLLQLEEPFSQEKLSDLVVADDTIFDIKDIYSYDFKWHQEFFQRIHQEYPALANLIYQHNSQLKTLASQLRMISDNGQTFLEVLNQLIKELRSGGEKITGELLASIPAAVAVANFFNYMNALPAETKDVLLALHALNTKKTLSKVLKHLESLGCVEIASDDIEDIIRHQKIGNNALLHQVPNISQVTYDVLQRQYQQGTSISSTREHNNSILPHYYLEKLAGRLSIKKMPDIVMALLSFPIEMYFIVLKNKFKKPKFTTVYELVNIINSGILSAVQIDTINQLILDNIDIFDIDNALDFAIATHNSDMTSFLFKKKSEKEQIDFFLNIQEINPDLPVLEITACNPSMLTILVNLLSPKNQKKLIEKTELLSLSTQNHESLKIIYELYSKDICSDVIKNDKNNNFWYELIKNTHSLEFILSIYTVEELRDLIKKEEDYANLLYCAFKNPLSLQLILSLYEMDTLVDIILKTYGENKKTMKYFLSERSNKKNLPSFIILMNMLSEKQKIEVILFKENNGNTLLHDAADYNNQFLKLTSFFSDEKDFFNALKINNNKGLSVIHTLLMRNPLLLETLFELMPEMPWFEAFQEKNQYDQTLFQLIANHPLLNKNILNIIHNIPLNLRFIILSEQKKYNSLNLDILLKKPLADATKEMQSDLLTTYLTYTHSVKPLDLLLKYLLDIISAKDIIACTSIENNLHQIFSYEVMHRPQLFKESFQLLTESQKITVLLQQKNDKNTLLHLILDNQLSLIPFILGLLTEKSIMQLINQKSCFGYTALYDFINNEQVIKEFLSALSHNMRWSVIMHHCFSGITFVHKTIQHPETFNTIFSLLTEEQRSDLLSQKTKLGSQFSFQIGRNDQSRLAVERYFSVSSQFFWEKNPQVSAPVKRGRNAIADDNRSEEPSEKIAKLG